MPARLERAPSARPPRRRIRNGSTPRPPREAHLCHTKCGNPPCTSFLTCERGATGRSSFRMLLRVKIGVLGRSAPRLIGWGRVHRSSANGMSDSFLSAPIDEEHEKDGGNQDRSNSEPLKPRPRWCVGLEGRGRLENSCGQNHSAKKGIEYECGASEPYGPRFTQNRSPVPGKRQRLADGSSRRR